jgi:hypothetical protein
VRLTVRVQVIDLKNKDFGKTKTIDTVNKHVEIFLKIHIKVFTISYLIILSLLGRTNIHRNPCTYTIHGRIECNSSPRLVSRHQNRGGNRVKGKEIDSATGRQQSGNWIR